MSIYHLHIPRTSGSYVRNNIVPSLITNSIQHFASNRTEIDIKHIQDSKFVSGHFGRMPLKYMDSPKVFCIIRDPVERFISYFKYTTGYITSKEAAENNLNIWLYGEQSKRQSNLQSKFLTGEIDVSEFNKNIGNFDAFIDNEWHLKNYSLDIDKIKESINGMNVYTMENHDQFIFDINNELEKQFGFKSFKYNDKSNCSPDVKVNISEDHLKRIRELNLIDYEVYDYVRSIEKK